MVEGGGSCLMKETPFTDLEKTMKSRNWFRRWSGPPKCEGWTNQTWPAEGDRGPETGQTMTVLPPTKVLSPSNWTPDAQAAFDQLNPLSTGSYRSNAVCKIFSFLQIIWSFLIISNNSFYSRIRKCLETFILLLIIIESFFFLLLLQREPRPSVSGATSVSATLEPGKCLQAFGGSFEDFCFMTAPRGHFTTNQSINTTLV